MNNLIPNFKVSYFTDPILDRLFENNSTTNFWHDIEGRVCAKSEIINKKYIFELIDFGYFLYDIKEDLVTVYPKNTENYKKVEDLYYRIFLPLILHLKGFETLHSSGIETSKGVVSFIGISGAGKSTTAYSFFKRGYKIWGDDCITIIKNKEDELNTVKIPFSLRLKNKLEDLKNFNNISLIKNEQKQLLMFFELIRKDEPSFKPKIERLDAKDSLEVLFKHSYYFSLHDKQLKSRMFKNFTFIANKLPVYRVQYATNESKTSEIVSVIEALF